MNGDLDSLSDRERETLRLLGRGHDAKSIASTLGLSVHTVNERLRDIRRKLGVSSSREAARLLLAREVAPETPKNAGYEEIGVAAVGGASAYPLRFRSGAAGGRRPLILAVTGAVMLVLVSVLATLSLAPADAPASSDIARPAFAMRNPPSVFRAEDYPAEALAKRAQGSTAYRLQISKTGAAEKCEIERSSGNAALDQATCQVLLSRLRFRPALDAAGRPVVSRLAGSIRWKLPE